MKNFRVAKQKSRSRGGLIALWLMILSVTASIAMAQTGGSYTLAWWTVDSGGGQSSNGVYTIVGTLGQPEANMVMGGGSFAVQGGFWPAGAVRVAPPVGDQQVYLPLVSK